MDLEKIEAKLDKTVSAGTAIDVELGGVKLENMIQMMELAKAMALAGPAVPPVFRGNPGLCLAIWIKATRFGFSAYDLAERAYVTVKKVKNDQTGRWEEVETIAYESAVLRAIINAHAPIKGRIKYAFTGEGDEVVCTASAITFDGEEVAHSSKPLGARKSTLRRNDEGKIKGSPLWDEKPLVQLAYDTGRDLCRIHFPEILLGWNDKDDFEDAHQSGRAAQAKDVTPPKSKLAERLKGGAGKPGFNKDHVDRETGGSSAKALTHDTSAVDMTPAADAKPAEEKVAVETAGGEQQAQAEQPAAPAETAEPVQEQAESDAGTEEDLRPQAFDAGVEAKNKNRPLHSVPDIYAGNPDLAEAFKDGWRNRDQELSEMETA